MKRCVGFLLLGTLSFAQMSGDMQMTPVTDEYTFIAGMIPHHQEAVDTALEVLVRSHRPEMQAFAWDIIKVQMEEIALMEGWLSEFYSDATTEIKYSPMMREQAGLSAEDLDRFFLEDMIVHHQMGVTMAEDLLENDYAQTPGVPKLAQNIIDLQSDEITLMSRWLESWYGVEATPMQMGN